LNGLSHWLQSIVIAVLFAICLEFLLPTHQLQRYVKTVMGLLILLILLAPVLTLGRSGFTIDDLMQQIQQQLHPAHAHSPLSQQEAGTSLQAIIQQSEQLKTLYHDQATAHVEQQLAQDIRQQLQVHLQAHSPASSQAYSQVSNVAVQLHQDASEEVVITSVHVTLQFTTQHELQKQSNEDTQLHAQAERSQFIMQPMQPVQPVETIQRSRDAPFIREAEASSYTAEKERCISWISHNWNLRRSQITIFVEQGQYVNEVSH
jgi:stage III sporulation protein AF